MARSRCKIFRWVNYHLNPPEGGLNRAGATTGSAR